MGSSATNAGVIATAGSPESRILARLGAISGAVWFDPAFTANVTRQLDGATWRITSITSRVTAYTVSQGTLALAPAEAFSPSGKRILSFAGAQFLSGSGALAALLQGSAAYSEVQIGARAAGGTTARWSAGLVAASPSNRIVHYIGGSNLVTRLREQASAQTQNTGTTVTADSVSRMYSNTYSGSVYAGWVNDVAETLSGSGVNTRAPATLDTIDIGCFRATGTPTGFWTGTLAGLVITPGTVLSTADRTAIEADLAAYHGY